MHRRLMLAWLGGAALFSATASGEPVTVSGGAIALESTEQLRRTRIPASVGSVSVSGYAKAGDGGAALYERATTSGPGPGTVSAADGVWWMLARQPFDIRMFGARCDGAADDTAPIQDAITFVGAGELRFPAGFTSVVSRSLRLVSGGTYTGGLRLRLADHATLPTAVMYGAQVKDCSVVGLEVDASADRKALAFGIWFDGGANNLVSKCYVHDTFNAGIALSSETGSRVLDNRVVDCGRDGTADNHGIMIFSITAVPMTDFVVSGNEVKRAFRKGIGTFAYRATILSRGVIRGNTVSSCGLGGIFCGSQERTVSPASDIVVENNVCIGNYVNIEITTGTRWTISGNRARQTTGGPGMQLDNLTDSTISDNVITDSAADGLKIGGAALGCSNLMISRNTIENSSLVGVGRYNGISIYHTDHARIVGNTIRDTATSPHQQYAVLEELSSDYNHIRGNRISGTSTGKGLFLTGPHTAAA